MVRGFGAIAPSTRHTGMQQQPVVLLVVVLLFSGAMVARLVWLQILHGRENLALADENRIRLVPRNPMRGRILDHDGRVLASSRLTYNLYIQPRLVSDGQWPGLRDRLASLVGVPASELDRQRRAGRNNEGYRIELAGNLRPEQVLRFREQAPNLAGAEVDVDYLRAYPYGSLAAHVLGYTSSVTAEEYDKLAEKGYRVQDRIGRSGVERVFESTLRGEWGGQQLEVNAAGQVQRVLGDKQARAGKDLRLTLDLELQKTAERALDGVRKGRSSPWIPKLARSGPWPAAPPSIPTSFPPVPPRPSGTT